MGFFEYEYLNLIGHVWIVLLPISIVNDIKSWYNIEVFRQYRENTLLISALWMFTYLMYGGQLLCISASQDIAQGEDYKFPVLMTLLVLSYLMSFAHTIFPTFKFPLAVINVITLGVFLGMSLWWASLNAMSPGNNIALLILTSLQIVLITAISFADVSTTYR